MSLLTFFRRHLNASAAQAIPAHLRAEAGLAGATEQPHISPLVLAWLR